MRRLLVLALLPLLITQLAGPAGAAEEDPADWYDTFEKPLPRLRITATMERDKDMPGFLRLVFGIVRYELEEGMPKLDRKTRRALLKIIDDPKLHVEYTGKQSLLAHAAGGQTIDANTVHIHQDGILVNGKPRDVHTIGKTLLHELGHVYSLRHDWFPNWGDKEAFPEALEAMLPARHLSLRSLARLSAHFRKKQEAVAEAAAGDASQVIAVIAAKDVAPGWRLGRKERTKEEAVSDFRHESQSRIVVRVSRHRDAEKALGYYDYKLDAFKKKRAKGRADHIRFRMTPELSAHAYVRWWRSSHSVCDGDLIVRIGHWVISVRGNFHGRAFDPEKGRDLLLRVARRLVQRGKQAMGA